MIKVYASKGTRSQRVLWALEELSAPYEVVGMTFPPRVHHPEFLAISPAGALRLGVIESTVADGRRFLAAGRLTLADTSVGYALGPSALSGLHDMLPTSVLAYEDRLKARPAYQRAYAPA